MLDIDCVHYILLRAEEKGEEKESYYREKEEWELGKPSEEYDNLVLTKTLFCFRFCC
jgi:hypothetical protein